MTVKWERERSIADDARGLRAQAYGASVASLGTPPVQPRPRMWGDDFRSAASRSAGRRSSTKDHGNSCSAVLLSTPPLSSRTRQTSWGRLDRECEGTHHRISREIRWP